MNRHISLHTPHGSLLGQFERPDAPRGLILLARSHHAPADTVIAANLGSHGYATLRMELLSAQEIQFVDATQNVPRLTQRLLDILNLIRNDGDMQTLPLAIFTNGDIAPAAIRAAAQRDAQVKALACHGGLIDRAGLQALELLVAPTLMMFNADDAAGQAAYQRAARHIGGIHDACVLESEMDPVLPVAFWFSKYFGVDRSNL